MTRPVFPFPVKLDVGGYPLWCQVGAGLDLHVVAEAEDDPDGEDCWTQSNGTTVCGETGRLTYPGVFSRLGAHRCETCCSWLDLPWGVGHPKNDDRCRELLGYPRSGEVVDG